MLSNVSRETKPSLFVVEGKNDREVLQRVTDAPILITHGLALSETFINELKLLENNYRIHLLLDPDGPGEKIRRVLRENLLDPVDIYVPLELAKDNKNKKVGIEHVSRETLMGVVNQGVQINPQKPLTTSEMFDLKLLGDKGSRILRQRLCDKLNIGTANAKTLRFKLMLYGFKYADVYQLLREIE